jgi:hypothetical protein
VDDVQIGESQERRQRANDKQQHRCSIASSERTGREDERNRPRWSKQVWQSTVSNNFRRPSLSVADSAEALSIRRPVRSLRPLAAAMHCREAKNHAAGLPSLPTVGLCPISG